MIPAQFVEGDSLTSYVRQLIDSGTNQPISLTNCTVNINLYYSDNDDVYPVTSPVTHPMTITDTINSIVSYQFLSSDLVAGYMWVVIKIFNSLGQVVSQTNPDIYYVRPNL